MKRVAVLLLMSAVTLGCHIGEVVNVSDDLGPTVNFTLQNINGRVLPYTPGDTLTNPHALVTDKIILDNYGGAEEVSTIRTRGAGQSTIDVRHEFGRFTI